MFTKIGLKILSVVLKSAKLLKFGLAAVSFASYAYLFTWKFSLLIMVALAWHESGHVWAMRKMGIKTKGFYFIPFLGGAAIAEEGYSTYAQSSFISLMGPVWGLILALMSAGVYYATGSPLFAAAAGWMALLNLFNLFPIMPLDGGQTTRAIAFSIGKNLGIVFLIASLIVSTIIMFKFKVGLFALLIIIGGLDLVMELFRRRNVEKQIRYYTDRADECVYEENKKSCLDKANALRVVMPATPMNKWEMAFTIASYVGVTVALIVIVKLMAHVPGGDLAEQFLADK